MPTFNFLQSKESIRALARADFCQLGKRTGSQARNQSMSVDLQLIKDLMYL